MGRNRYETRVAASDRDDADGQDLAAAQFYPSRSDGQGITGWIVSGTSSDHYAEAEDAPGGGSPSVGQEALGSGA
jgi:hypothetical protein